MDYATNPVQVTPGPQPAASGTSNASPAGSGVLNFNGFLQSASATPAVAGTADAVQAKNSSANNAVFASAPAEAKAAITSQLAINESVDNGATGKLANYLLSAQTAVSSQMMAPSQTRSLSAVSADLIGREGEEAIDSGAMMLNGPLQQALAGDAHARHGGDARQSHIDVALVAGNPRSTVNGDLPAPGLATTETPVKALPKSAELATIAGTTSARAATTIASIAGGDTVTLDDTVSNLTEIKKAGTQIVAGKGLSDTAVTTQALNPNDSVLKVDRGTAAGMQQGVNGQVVAESMASVQPRGSAPIAANMPNEPRIAQSPTGIEHASLQGNGATVSTSIAATGVAQGLLSRQRNSAANDESVSQIARGGNEARLLELNGARTTSAATQANAVVTTATETTTEIVAKHTNAVTLAATRDEKSLRTALPVVNQTQMAARIGGVDVTQIGSVDFASTQIDTAPGSQSISRVAILEPGWTSQLGSDLRALVARGPSTTQVQVTPAELGPLDIEVSVNRQEVSVRILAMHGQTREMLEAALPRLREALGQSYTSVEVSVGNGSGNSSSQGQGQQAGSQTGMQMMSDAQDGLRDSSNSTTDPGLADEADNGDGITEPSNEDSDTAADGSLVVESSKPSRGLVDAYA